jgi:UDP-N-acetylglucosamine:LPS N-acetylglucosamine transferase
MAKVLLVASPGGHLVEILTVARELSDKHECILCTSKAQAMRGATFVGVARVYYAPICLGMQKPFGLMLSMLVELFVFLRVFLKERPDCVISTGSIEAVPAFLLNRLFFRRPALYLESLARVRTRSQTGVLVKPLATRIFAQWPEVAKQFGPRGEYHGRLL